jgi:nucleolar complex protein 3
MDSDNELNLEDEDLELLKEYGDHINFLSTMGEHQPTRERKRKIQQVDEEEYEKIPRRITVTESTALPVKDEKGKLVIDKPIIKVEKIAPVQKPAVKTQTTKIESKKRKEKKPLGNAVTIATIKETLAEKAMAITEDPEKNIGMTKELFAFVKDSRPNVAKIAMLTMLAIYKDCIPGYFKIETDTESEV